MPGKNAKFISWNVNGWRSCARKGLYEFISKWDPDVIAFQETKMQEAPEMPIQLAGYTLVWNPAGKKGYAGTAVLSREKPEKITKGIGAPEFDSEGRNITLEFRSFFFVNAYFPNSQHGLARLDFKARYNNALKKYLEKLSAKKPVVLCGDFNVAHQEIDIARPKENEKNAGFTPEERSWMSEFISSGNVDTFRHLHPDAAEYTWWSYRFNARARNIGWRIDYFTIPHSLLPKLKKAYILREVNASDHAPVAIEMEELM
jgi:exodeoxyribonuclease-3